MNNSVTRVMTDRQSIREKNAIMRKSYHVNLITVLTHVTDCIHSTFL